MTMGEKIKLLREQNNMTLEELGNKVGVGKSTVRKWENGMIANMRRDKIAKIAHALRVSPAYLMGWVDNLENSKEIGLPEESTDNPNDAFYESLTDEQKAEITRLYQLYQKADPAHKLAVEALLKETPPKPEHPQS